MAEEAAETKETNTTNGTKKLKCPCCGELTLTQPLDVKGVTLDEFMASIITGTPYAHTYKMFSGSVEITVESLTKQLSNMLSTAVKLLNDYAHALENSEQANGKVAEGPVKELIGTMKLYFGVKTITMYKNKQIVKQYMPADIMQEAAATILQAAASEDPDAFSDAVAKYIERCLDPDVLSVLHTDAIRTVVVTHGDIYMLLLTAGFDENFWEGIELA